MDIEQMKKELAELRAYKEAAEMQEPFRWAIDHFALGIGTTLFDSEQEAIDFSRNLAGSSKAIPLYANPVPAEKPARITEQDAREMLEAYWDSSDDCGDWLKSVDGRALLNKLNADRQVPADQVPDAIQLLQRVAASTTEKPAVSVPDFETWWRSLPSYRDADKPAAKMAWDYLARLVTSPSQSQQNTEPSVVVPDVANEEMLSEGIKSLQRGLNIFGDKLTQIVSNIWEDMYQTAPSQSQQSARTCDDAVLHALEKAQPFVEMARESGIAGAREAEILMANVYDTVRDRCPSHESEQGGEV